MRLLNDKHFSNGLLHGAIFVKVDLQEFHETFSLQNVAPS